MFVLKVRTVIVALIVTVMSFTTVMLTITADEAGEADEVSKWMAKSVCHSDYDKIYDPENPCVAGDKEACDAKPKFTLTLEKVIVLCFYGIPGSRCRYKKSEMPEGEGSCVWENNKCTEGDPPTKVKKDDCEDIQIAGWAPHLEQ